MSIAPCIVCFFLSFAILTPSVSSFEQRLYCLEKQTETCTEENASSVSQAFGLLYRDVMRQKKEYEENLIELEEECAELEKDVEQTKEQLEKEVVLLSESLLREPDSLVENMESSSCNTIYLRYSETKTQLSINQEQKEEISENLSLLKEQEHRILNAQKHLSERYPVTFTEEEMLSGEPDPQKVIRGTRDLPAYGAIVGDLFDTQTSCLSGDVSISQTSASFQSMISGAAVSAGTWEYPGGGLHLGLDLASALYTPVTAPANGIVLYADTPVDSESGYLGCRDGWPYGGGNTLCMIVSVDEKLYAVTLAHLSSEIYVFAGQQFQQGDVLALSGNSGNSTGPHTHIEVFEIHVSLEEAVAYFMQGADFSFGCGWNAPATFSAIAARIRPEEVLL